MTWKEFKKELIKKIYKKDLKRLKYLSKVNRKFIICFSAVPGSGKTYVAKALEKRYQGVRISTDEIRKILKELSKDYKEISKKNQEKIINIYLSHFIKGYNFKNKLIILDASIDRRYKQLFSKIRQKGFNFFIIRIELQKKKLKERILLRNKKEAKIFLDNLDKWFEDFKEFKSKRRANILLKNTQNLKILYSKLDKYLKQ